MHSETMTLIDIITIISAVDVSWLLDFCPVEGVATYQDLSAVSPEGSSRKDGLRIDRIQLNSMVASVKTSKI